MTLKTKYLITILLSLTTMTVLAQLRFGVKGGISTYDLGVNDAIEVLSDGKDFLLDVQNAKYGYHFGFVLQAKIASFVIQPEVAFNSNSVDYSFAEVSGTTADIFTEKYQHLDIPIMLGLKAGPMRLMLGPVGHYFLKSTSELLDFESYDQKFEELTYGYQTGIGIDFLNVMIDVRYEGNFSKFGDHIIFSGEQYSFDNSPARLLASLAIAIK